MFLTQNNFSTNSMLFQQPQQHNSSEFQQQIIPRPFLEPQRLQHPSARSSTSTQSLDQFTKPTNLLHLTVSDSNNLQQNSTAHSNPNFSKPQKSLATIRNPIDFENEQSRIANFVSKQSSSKRKHSVVEFDFDSNDLAKKHKQL